MKLQLNGNTLWALKNSLNRTVRDTQNTDRLLSFKASGILNKVREVLYSGDTEVELTEEDCFIIRESIQGTVINSDGIYLDEEVELLKLLREIK